MRKYVDGAGQSPINIWCLVRKRCTQEGACRLDMPCVRAILYVWGHQHFAAVHVHVAVCEMRYGAPPAENTIESDPVRACSVCAIVALQSTSYIYDMYAPKTVTHYG